ncbi:adenylate kinase ADK2 [Ascoidea rubescens DSM 1968]|uniref:GTP:AMP phosphotransferase, mitochondrial n=1 Tax=Ascoidea rubescens DSM 1968 TaxID=1344418 RepID=A0A1D2VEB3_9ASCO|nr:adenylate kinase [Ascoidea rubescens DSM 1968]ODV59991.1 adenylate kinase [Ascoidea rubescens DSM 1968]
MLSPFRCILLGAPGAGKGTQLTRLVKHHPDLCTVISGNLLRQEISSKTPIGLEVENTIKKGGLVPDSLIIDLIFKNLKIEKLLNDSRSWLLDGFPRTVTQALKLDENLSKHNSLINLVVELKVPESVILERIENRWIHQPSGRVYNIQYNPPRVPNKDDVTGEPLTKRPDDNAEVFKKRLETYYNEATPLKEYYQKRGILHSVEGETSDIIFPKLIKLIENKFSV